MDVLQDVQHLLGGLSRNRATQHLRLDPLDHIALVVGDSFHHVGLHSHSAVGDRLHRAAELNRCTSHTLTETDGSRVDLSPVLSVAEQAFALTHQVDSGFVAEAKLE